MKEAVTPHTELLLDLFYRALSDPDAEVQTNAAFASGLLVEHSQVDLSPQYLHLLAAFRPLFTIPADAPTANVNARDNAVGAVSRMIYKNTAAVPLDQVLPILFGAVPLTQDHLENRPLFRTIFHLFKTQPQALHPYLDKLVSLFAYVLDPNAPDQIGDEVRAELISLLAVLYQEVPEKIRAAGLTPFVEP
jgi:importin-4